MPTQQQQKTQQVLDQIAKPGLKTPRPSRRMSIAQLRDRWSRKANELLVGKTITEVRYLPVEEREGLGWDDASVEFFAQNPDGTGRVSVLAQGDDEGNMAGVLNVIELDNHMEQTILGVL